VNVCDPERCDLPHPGPCRAEQPDNDPVGEGFLFGIELKSMAEAFGDVLLVKPSVEFSPLVLLPFRVGDAIGRPDLAPGPTAEDFEHRQVVLDGGAREPFGDKVIHEELRILDQGFHIHDAPFGGEDAEVMQGVTVIILCGFGEAHDLRT
jgi:hypothetical protein